MPKLSIIVPVYNVEKYLDDCLNSILQQTYSDWELILVDDGSQDGSGAICDSYAASDNRITVIHTENRGQSHARNLALDIAKGEYVTFIDADDYLGDINTHEYAINVLEKNPQVDILQYPYEGIGWHNSNNGLHNNKDLLIQGPKEAILNLGIEGLNGLIYPAPWAKVYRSICFNEHRFPIGIVFEDSYLLTDIFKEIKFIKLIKKGCYNYRCNNNGTMLGNNTPKKSNDQLTSHLHTLEACSELNIDCDIYSRFYNVIFYDTYCAVIHYKDNIFSSCNIQKLGKLRPKSLISPFKKKILIKTAQIIGYNHFFNIIALLRKFK